MTSILIPFHKGDQDSAKLIIENALSFDSGLEGRLAFRLQFDASRAECRIEDSIDRLRARFDVEFLTSLPSVHVPDSFRKNDPNSNKTDERHTVRTPETKERILCWNRAVFSAIREVDLFAVVEPDCVILKNGWAKDIFDAAEKGLAGFPIFGHLKTGLIGGNHIPTHYAGCSVYDGARLRSLIDESVFSERYDNPWWPLRRHEPTELAGNCFWGPVFSGYDISFDYFLYAHLQRLRNGHARPLDWRISDLCDGSEVIKCDFRSRRSIEEIFSSYFGRLPVLHGVKDDAVRHAAIKRARGGVERSVYPVGGKKQPPIFARDQRADEPQVVNPALSGVSAGNDRFISLSSLSGRYANERCFIIANGPSLKKTDLRPLRNEFTIGLNRINLNFENMGFEPTFLCCVNKNVIDQFSQDFDRSSSVKFLTAYSENVLKNRWNTFFMNSLPKVGYFEKDLSTGAWCEGWTVTYCAMQLAYYLGFKETVLVGLDHFFGNTGKPNEAVTESGTDQNHFHPEYFGKGVVWQYPDLERSEQHYRVARATFEADGRRIIDATIGGHCDIFEKGDYQSILSTRVSGVGDRRPVSLSVVMPFKNAARHIEKAVGSVLAQGVQDVEIICVDDASDDESAEILKRLLATNPSIRLIESPARGVSAARNAGIEAASGEFVAFLDADDEYLEGSLKVRLAAFAGDRNLHLVHGEAVIVDDQGQDLGLRLGSKRDLTFDDAWTNPAHLNTVMVRRSFLKGLRFDEAMTNGEDWKFLASLLRAGATSRFVEGGGAQWRFWGASTTSRDLPGHFEKLNGVINWLTSPSTESRVVSQFAAGVKTKTRSELVMTARRRMFASYLLFGDVDGARATLEAMERADEKKASATEWLPTLKFSAVRVFSTPVSKLAGIDSDARAAINNVVSKLDLRLRLPGLAAAVDELFSSGGGHEAMRHEGRGEIREYSRSSAARIDETRVVALLLSGRKGADRIMIDVGAHFGGSAAYFNDLGWTIHCFEPDPANRVKLRDRFANVSNITIDSRAVSDKAASGVSFFSSDESTGISGLSAFRESHRESAKVDVTTVSDIIRDRKLSTVDFLKIDVEGFDLSVLKGVPWNKMAPDVVECEFEDAKTVPLGHTWRDIAEYLKARGYRVYISEWHPIMRYGVAHDWRRVVPYGVADPAADSWGNLLAFRVDPGYAAVNAAFETLVTLNKKPSAPEVMGQPVNTNASVAHVDQKTPHPTSGRSTAYVQAAESVHRVSPRLYLALRAIRRAALHFWSRKSWAVPAAAIAAALFAGGFHPAIGAKQPTYFALWAAGVSAAFVSYLIFRFYSLIGRLSEENRALYNIIDQNRNTAATGAASLQGRIEKLQRDLDSRGKKLDEANVILTAKADAAADKSAQDIVALAELLRVEIKTALGALAAATEGNAQKSADALRTEMAAKIAAATGNVELQVREIGAELSAYNQRYGGIDETLMKLRDNADAQAAKIGRLSSEVESISAVSAPNNAALYQRFNRKLTVEHQRVFEVEWRKKLSIAYSRQSLGYAATRACALEERMTGRLATSIEDVVLRSLVAKSVKGTEIEILEIGTLFGIGAAIVYDAVRPHFEKIGLTLLDPLDGYYSAQQADILTGELVTEKALLRNMKAADIPIEDLTLIRRLSTDPEAYEEAAKRRYDLLIIDGDHTYAGVKTDFDIYAPLVKLGGYIVIDDYGSPDWPDVTRFVDEEVASREDVSHVGTSWRTCVYRVVRPRKD